MRISIGDHDSEFYLVIDRDTGSKIDNCLWADDVSGEYKVVCVNNKVK